MAYSKEPGGTRYYEDNFAYSGLIGYYSSIYGTSGIENTLDIILTHSKSEEDNKRGADVTLTLDLSLQKKAYELIKDFDGSAVVLNAKTGEILALASSNTFDLSKIDDASYWEEINNSQGTLLPNAYKNAVTPGSVFKIVTSKEIIEAGIAEEEINDDKGYLIVNGQKISNYKGQPSGTISYQEALVHSSNVYFMDRALKLGVSTMKKTAASFLLGESIALDFDTIKSTFNLGDESDNMLASTAYGQGNTEVTPLQMAMITQSIANDGVMLKPYLFASAVDGKGNAAKYFTAGATEELTKTMEPNTAQTIREAMTAAAEHYELSTVGDGYQIAAKTGTAETGRDNKNHAWIVTFAPADDPQYVIVVNKLNTSDIGRTLAPVAEELYDQLFDQE